MIVKKSGESYFSPFNSVSFTYSQNNVFHLKSPNGKIDMALENGTNIVPQLIDISSLWFCNIKNLAGDNVV